MAQVYPRDDGRDEILIRRVEESSVVLLTSYQEYLIALDVSTARAGGTQNRMRRGSYGLSNYCYEYTRTWWNTRDGQGCHHLLAITSCSVECNTTQA